MLNALTPEAFNELMAFEELDPDPVEHLADQLALIGAAICRTLGAQIQPEDLLPAAFRNRGDTGSDMQADALVGVLRGFYGNCDWRSGSQD